jgi:hypothetical protein
MRVEAQGHLVKPSPLTKVRSAILSMQIGHLGVDFECVPLKEFAKSEKDLSMKAQTENRAQIVIEIVLTCVSRIHEFFQGVSFSSTVVSALQKKVHEVIQST